ncbi:glycosyltransferase family 4 protein [Nitrolancea hollandica]|uniref:Glycosyl transferase group 1 n=1 Tax=Nitrolancea hollandica Lb TaxID=1129897 RepID=I4EEB4_9BACT|nr:glycosyltransferase family 4 protein [Nitrolancea hollandica]CCF83026.1 Glycosyl transferase group 1 [Nitrolancea hollandica Lb]
MTRTLVVALLTLGDPNRLTGGYLYHRRIAELAPRSGARIIFRSIPNLPFPLPLRQARAALERVYRIGADAIVLDSIAAAFFGPWLSLSRPRLPLIGMLHQPPGGIDHGPYRTAFQARMDRLAYRRARRLLVASESLAEELIADGIPSGQLLVVPPGRDVAPVVAPPPEDLRQGRKVAFLCVGNWVERKGIHHLLDAFARLSPEAATLHLAGDDRVEPGYAARVRSRLADPDLAGRVVMHGRLPVSEVAGLYQAADAFVLPSIKEPYGTVYGEAMTFGLPVVGWRAGNLPYLAEHEREGLLVPPGDIEGLAGALERLAGDGALRRRLGEAGRARALTRPTWEETAALFFQAVRDVVEER